MVPVLPAAGSVKPSVSAIAAMDGVRSASTLRINAARSLGASEWQVFRYVVFPSALHEIFTGARLAIGVVYGTLIVLISLGFAFAILNETALSFLGLGAQPPLPEWGAMISTGRKFIFDQWWVATVPGFAIFIVSLGFNLLGDAMRDLLDPHLRQRR